jgi:hypothetical protein
MGVITTIGLAFINIIASQERCAVDKIGGSSETRGAGAIARINVSRGGADSNSITLTSAKHVALVDINTATLREGFAIA